MKSRVILFAASAAFVCAAPITARAEPPTILELRIQAVKGKNYFHVRLQRPADILVDGQRANPRFDPWGMPGTDPALRPRLVPQDDGARLIYGRDTLDARFAPGMQPPGAVPAPPFAQKMEDKKDFQGKGDVGPVDSGLEFFGVFAGNKKAPFVLLYPMDPGAKAKKKTKPSLHELLQEKRLWAEVTIYLDPAKATKLPLPDQGFRRDENRPLELNDLEGNWAVAQGRHFAQLEAQTPEFGFYGFARETTNRIYKVRMPEPWRPW